MRENFKILGISLDASKGEVKKAYRSLAKKYHPDRGGDEDKFKTLSAAYTEVLKVVGRKTPRFDFNDHREDARGYSGFDSGTSRVNFASSRPVEGYDLHYKIYVYPEQLAARVQQRFEFARNTGGGFAVLEPQIVRLLVKIPLNAEFGETLRFKTLGSPGRNGGASGDLLLTLVEKKHA